MRDLLSQVWLSAARRALTYGIAIASLGLGVVAFICLSAFTQSFTDNLKRRVDASDYDPGAEVSLETGPTIAIQVGSKRPKLDAAWVSERVRHALTTDVGAMTSDMYDVKIGRYALRDWTLFAVSSDWLKLRPHFWGMRGLIAGRLFTPEDDRSGDAVCLTDQRVARALPSGIDPVGQTLKVNGRPFRIVGVVWAPDFYRPGGSDGLVFISLSAASPLLRLQPPERLSFVTKSDEAGVEPRMNDVESAVSRALGRDYAVTVTSPWLDLKGARYQLAYMRLFLGLVSLLPLIVGLLAMVSMLLANLNTRLREIGLHRALGATRPRQAALVFCEAGLTGLLASLLGIPAGLLVLHLLASTWGSELRPAPGGLTFALLSGTATALLAALLPARAAMRISPCDALRAE